LSHSICQAQIVIRSYPLHSFKPLAQSLRPNIKMRSFTNALLAGAAATTVLAQDALDYVQNYNGDLAAFTYDEGAGTYSAN